MKTHIKYNQFFAYSEEHDKSFYTDFGDGINIIYGRNTSGKSTLIQAINFTFGINDESKKLKEVVSENVIFRLDLEIFHSTKEKIIIIRDANSVFIIREDEQITKFRYINSNQSKEHDLLKKYLSNMLGFNMFLDYEGKYKLGSLESMFLPYYVAQDQGWRCMLKSFTGLEFCKGFKFDYYDYYLGISNAYDREKKKILEEKRSNYKNKIEFLGKIEKSTDELQLSKLKDEAFISQSAKYLEQYKIEKGNLIEEEKNYLRVSNQIKFLEQRILIIKTIKRNKNEKKVPEGVCPTCHQKIHISLEEEYEKLQNFEDTKNQLQEMGKSIKTRNTTLNKSKKEIDKLRKSISESYSVLQDYQVEDLSVNTWLDNKVNVRLSEMIIVQIGKVGLKLKDVIEELKKFKTGKEINDERKKIESSFMQIFQKYLLQLNLNISFDDEFLYSNQILSQQGVALLKLLLAYYFAFNELIKKTSYVHRFPFVLDAIFKEDVDESNRELILNFIAKNHPKDTQTIFSIAESKDNNKTADYYNKAHFDSTAKMILISTEKERSFLSAYNKKYDDIKNETLKLIEF